uniref:Uncharacterized protein n=1 Tax=Bartonella schoenbuchensis (strain DSM 13525 / NCTC 13165 / R1) TaxID=687861 RepID=E6Z1U2_BARSR|nr:hypothetical protein BARSC_190353 [Bartonella schoenbuchensis R1]
MTLYFSKYALIKGGLSDYKFKQNTLLSINKLKRLATLFAFFKID